MRLPRVRFNVQPMMILALGVPATAAALVAALLLSPAQATPPGGVSLMETLSEWRYPGSNMLGGASMSDGGNPLVQSVKCRAILTTPDPIDKVIAFYSVKVGTPPAPRRQDARDPVKDSDAKSVSTQDDSQGRPVTLRVIVVNKADPTTTQVIRQGQAETETPIAWLHDLRLDGRR